MSVLPAWMIALAAAGAGAALAAGAQQLRVAGLRAEHARYEARIEKEKSAAWEVANARKDELERLRAEKSELVAGIDKRVAMEREDASQETEARLRGIAAGTVRVRYVAAQCPAATRGDVPAAAGATGVVDAAGIELSPEAGIDVQLLRQSVRIDSVQIEGLKEYIRKITEISDGGH